MSETPELGKEYIQPNEDRDIAEMIEVIRRRLAKVYAPGKVQRQFHPKMHGFVSAKFRVDPELPVSMRHGFLVPGKTYDAWLRFSNGNSRASDDHKADLRGMAIKLLNVPGEMLEGDAQMPQSQDILLVSYPTLMSPNVAAFKKNIRALCGGIFAMIWFGLNPGNWATLVRTLRSMKKTSSLFSLQYFSVSPYRLGAGTGLGAASGMGSGTGLRTASGTASGTGLRSSSGTASGTASGTGLRTVEQAVKYSVVPASRPMVLGTDRGNPHFLRDNMQEELNKHSFIFNFLIQFQEDAVEMPIENPCVEWKSQWHKVGQIIIPEQVFDTSERNHAGEQASFSPWHSLPEHRPLGGVSRARRKVYAAISAFRRENNREL